jgi:hypothetical protein
MTLGPGRRCTTTTKVCAVERCSLLQAATNKHSTAVSIGTAIVQLLTVLCRWQTDGQLLRANSKLHHFIIIFFEKGVKMARSSTATQLPMLCSYQTWCQKVPVGTGWYQLMPVGTGWCQLVQAGASWCQLMPVDAS